MSRFTRRKIMFASPLWAAAATALAQTAKAPINARKLSQMTLTVTDLKRSLDFYQGLFGMPVQARQGATVLLRVGSGPQYLALKEGSKAGYSHYGLAVEGFNAGQIAKILIDRGLTKADGDPGPMQFQIRSRSGITELFVGDPSGIMVQLQDTSYCGGSGPLGNICRSVVPSPRKGLLTLRDLSHFTIFAPDPARSQAFYKDLFGLFVQAHQGPSAPVWGVGAGPQFLMLAGSARGGAVGSINHGCFLMDGFQVEAVQKALESYGLKPRGEVSGPAGPLVHYVSMRMENRGGAPGGTPELYFTDPDGILLQLQDPTYCGGGGKLGEICKG